MSRSHAHPAMQRGLNVLLITADQWRGDCLGVAGHPHVQTPHLDALAADGVRFARHYSGAVPCSPARACLYTGLYQMNNRVCVNGTPLDARHDTLALAARRLGYDPNLFGYTDQTSDPRGLHPNDPATRTYENLLPGFTWRARVDDAQTSWLSWLETQGCTDALRRPNLHIPIDGVDDPPRGKAPRYDSAQTDTAFLVGELSRWLGEQRHRRARQSTHRWFAHLSVLRPHPPFTVPEPYNTLIDPATIDGFAGAGDWQAAAALHPLLDWLHGRTGKSHFIAGAEGLVRDWTHTDRQHIAAIYYGMIAEVDAQIGRLLQALADNEFMHDTLIVFTSDHGEMLGDHGLFGKHGFHDSSYHVPLIVRHPQAETTRGRCVNTFTESVDVFPTVIDLLGGELPGQLDGQSLAPALFEAGSASTPTRDAAHWEWDFRSIDSLAAERHFGIDSRQCNLAVHRGERYKYVHFNALPPLLFDMQEDPGETRNLAGDPDFTAVRLDAAESLLSWRAKHLDQTLSNMLATPDGIRQG